MPEVLAAAVAYAIPATEAIAIAGTTISYASIIATTAMFVGGAQYSRRQQKKALRAAAGQGIEDRRFTTRGSNEPKQIIVGRTRAGGVQLAPGWTYGANSQYWTVPVAFAGHEITSFDDVWLGEESVGVLDGSGYVTSGSKWFKGVPVPKSVTIAGGAPATYHEFSGGLNVLRVDSVAYIMQVDSVRGWEAVTLEADVDYTISRSGANNLRVNWVTDQTGRDMIITYAETQATQHLRCKQFLGIAAGERDTELEYNSGGEWLSTDVGKSIARLHLTFLYDQDIFPSGAPNVSAIIKGAKVYDPRLDSTNGGSGSQRHNDPATWTWSENPALIWAWYMTSVLGMRCTSAEIDWPSVITAANICDESVPLANSAGNQKRYTCNGVLSTADDVRSNVDKILSSMVGTRYLSGGKWYIKAGAYSTPVSGMAFDEDDFAGGDIQILPRTRYRDLFNAIRGQFIDDHAAGALGSNDAGGFYAPTDFPGYASATYAAEDGEELWEDIELPMTHDWRRAERIAKLMLFRARQAMTIALNLKMRAYKLQPGDTFTLTNSVFGWTNKIFRVVDRVLQVHGTIQILAQEEASAVYAWNFSEEVNPDPAPNTELPDPRIVSSLQNFRLSAGDFYRLPDGTVVPYAELTWDAITDSAVLSGGRIEIWWKRSVDTVYRKIEVRPTETSYRIEPIAGNDVINVVAWVFNGSQVRSSMASATRRLDADLPVAIVAPAISGNRLPNATLEFNVAHYSFAVPSQFGSGLLKKEDSFPIKGSPSNMRLQINSLATGTDKYAYAETVRRPVKVGQKYCAFAGMIAWGVDAYVGIHWINASGVGFDTSWSQKIGNKFYDGSLGLPSRPQDYEVAEVLAVAPEGAVEMKLFFWAANWTASDSFGSKYLFITEPFFGEIDASVTQRPVWDPGGNNSVGTESLVDQAATEVVRSSFVPLLRMSYGQTYPLPGYSYPGTALHTMTITAPANVTSNVTVEIVINFEIQMNTPSNFGMVVGMQLIRSDGYGKPFYTRRVATCPVRSYEYKQAVSLNTETVLAPGQTITIYAVPHIGIDQLIAGATATADIVDSQMKCTLVKK